MTVARSVARAVASPVARAVGAGIGGGLHTYFTDNEEQQPPTGWTNQGGGVTVTTDLTGFFGATSATQIIVNNDSNRKRYYGRSYNATVNAAGWRGVRFYYKPIGTCNRVALQEGGGGQCATVFDCDLLTATPFGTRPADWADIQALSNGWFECRASRNFSDITWRMTFTPIPSTWATISQFYDTQAGDGTSGGLFDRIQITTIKGSLAEVQSAIPAI